MKATNRKGQQVNTSRSGGRSVAEVWAAIFRDNEYYAACRDWVMVLTDEQITMKLFAQFPDRTESKVFRDVGRVRARFNRGALSPKIERPAIRSRRYVYTDGTRAKRPVG